MVFLYSIDNILM